MVDYLSSSSPQWFRIRRDPRGTWYNVSYFRKLVEEAIAIAERLHVYRAAIYGKFNVEILLNRKLGNSKMMAME